MNAYSFSGLLVALNSLILGVLVLVWNPNKKLGKIWFAFTGASAIWGLGILLIGFTRDEQSAYWIWRISYMTGVIWIAPTFYHFVCLFLDLKRKKSIALNYGIGFLFVLSTGTTAFFRDIKWMFDSLYYVRAGWLYVVFFFWWLLLVSLSHLNMLRIYPSLKENKKNQVKYFFLATTVGYTGGILSYLPKFGVNLYPWGNYLVCLYPVIMGYAILKYNLMDVRVFIRRTGLLIFIYAVLLLASTPILLSLNHDFISGTTPALGWLKMIGITGVMTLGPVFYALLVRQSQYFQEKKASGLTHELKSPLAAIQGALETIQSLQETLPQNPKMAEYLGIIDRSSQRLGSFVNELLQVFNLQDMKTTLDLKETDLNQLLQKIAADHKPSADLKSNELILDLPKDTVWLNCDGPKIEIAVSNLVSNAIKFTSQGTVRIALTRTEKEITISVEDTGPGIDPEDLPHIFEPFYQGKLGKGGKGSGIGLTIAKAFVEAHGGEILLKSIGYPLTINHFKIKINLY